MSLYNDDEVTPPEWINQQFFEKVLNNYEKCDDIQVINLQVSPASAKGDHYASIMFRCKVSYRTGNDTNQPLHRSLIIKTLPMEEGVKREMLQNSQLFETEINMYTKTLPKIKQILAECGEPTTLSAKIFYHSLQPHKVLVLEDLCESGFDVVRGRYLTEEEVKAVYRKIAKLHAVSYMLGHSQECELVNGYRKGYLNSSLPVFKSIMPNGLVNFAKMLSSYEEFHIYYEKFCSIKDKLYESSKDLFNAFELNDVKDDIFVLNHGDFHMKNLMFKLDDNNQLQDMMMVDYQISCYAPSAVDMFYSQFLILSGELRLKRHELMFYYFSEFTRILKKIKCPGVLPQFSQFQMTALKYRHYPILLLAVVLPLVSGVLCKSAEELKDVDFAKFTDSTDMIAATYHKSAFLEDIRKFMPVLLREGYFD